MPGAASLAVNGRPARLICDEFDETITLLAGNNAIELAATYDLKVIAKNPGLIGSGAVAYVAHPNVHGIIVERGAGKF